MFLLSLAVTLGVSLVTSAIVVAFFRRPIREILRGWRGRCSCSS